PDQFDAIAGGVIEADEGAHLAQRAFGFGTGVHRVADAFELGGGGIEFGAAAQFEGGDVIGRIAFEIAQRVLARVGAEVDRVAAALGDLEPEDFSGVAGGAFEITRTEADVGDVAQFDHGGSTWTSRSCGRPRAGASAPYSAMRQSLPQLQCEAGPAANWRGAALPSMRRPSATRLKYTPS